MGAIGFIIGLPFMVIGGILWFVGMIIYILFKPFAIILPCGSCCECAISLAMWCMESPFKIANYFISCIPC
ncbi:unnamed protein product [Sphagnum balticum]